VVEHIGEHLGCRLELTPCRHEIEEEDWIRSLPLHLERQSLSEGDAEPVKLRGAQRDSSGRSSGRCNGAS
jgi:hypothetical protein